jgi:peptidoglycan/xylan/chitin deacetylase (PgdA/CDA1 family)
MTLRSLAGAAHRTVLCSLHRRMVRMGNHDPIVSFSFDDFPRSAYLVGAPILEAFGGRGTYYATTGFLNTSDGLGDLFQVEDLRGLLERGHELGTQTFHHSSCRKVSLAEFQDDVHKGIRELERLGERHSGNFCYPYGHVTLGTKRTLAAYLASARSVYPGINGPEVDLNLLRANALYGDMSGARHAQKLIEQNVAQKGWLIFYTHDVRPHPSEYGCTPELFESAVSIAARSGSRILTVERVLAEIGADGQVLVPPRENKEVVSGECP